VRVGCSASVNLCARFRSVESGGWEVGLFLEVDVLDDLLAVAVSDVPLDLVVLSVVSADTVVGSLASDVFVASLAVPALGVR